MSITAASVNELRQKTGAGMMECKKALTETAGDMEKAVDVLRKRGLAAAAKKAGRTAAEGLVTTSIVNGGKTGVVIEINCETDFVAKTEDFQGFVNSVAQMAATSKAANPEALVEEKFAGSGNSLKDTVTALVAKIGENIQVRRFERFSVQGEGAVNSYIHRGGQIGCLVEVGCESAKTSSNAEFHALVKDLCLHVAANKPLYLVPTDVPADVLTREKDIAMDQARQQGKKEEFLGKIAEGKANKFYEEFCFVEQGFVKDPGTKIKKLLEESSKKFGDKLVLRRFARFELGEGIEKKSSDFAAEVAATIGAGKA
jgi:elongation factor Ts